MCLFVAFSFVGKYLNTKFQKILSNGLDFAIFFHSRSILAVFLAKKAQEMPKSKNSFLSIFFCWEASNIKYQISENFIKQFGFCQSFSFLVNFGCFLAKNGQKRLKLKNSFFVAFSFVGKHLNSKFLKIPPNGLGLANFLHFWSFLAVFWLKNGHKKPKSKKSFFVAFCFVEKHLYSKFQKISSNCLDFANFLLFWSILAVFW